MSFWSPWGAKHEAVTIRRFKTAHGDSSAGIGGMIIKISVNILQETQKKLVKNFFQQMLFFGQNWPKFRIFRFFGTPKIAEIFDKMAEITAGYG